MARSKRWTCARCGVSTSFRAGEEPSCPEGWAKLRGEWYCLRCRREDVMEQASNSAGGAENGVQRRRALMEFELLRSPTASDRLIARRVKCSTGAVRPVREALTRSGKLPPSDPD